MKQIIAFALCLIMLFSLCACGVKPGENTKVPDFTEAPVVTLADGSVVYSKEPFVESPQTGEYKETALLTNVPGQGVPLLLDMREDGTIDYIFADVDELADLTTCAESGMQYYTIAPDGTATRQDTQWMEDLDNYMAQTLETTQDPNGKWRLLFASDEGTILILAQYHNVVQVPLKDHSPDQTGEFMYSVLFKVVSGTVTIIPLEWEITLEGRLVDLRSEYITSFEFEDNQITLSKRSDIYNGSGLYCDATYNLDGTLISAQKLQKGPFEPIMNTYLDDTGFLVCSIDPALESQVPQWAFNYDWRKTMFDQGITTFSDGTPSPHFATPDDIQYTEDDTLYYLGKHLYNMKAVANGDGKDFCCWFDEAGMGLLMRYTYAPEGKIDPEVVTVWSWEPIDLIETAVAQWNHTHTSPIFRYETATDEMEGANLTEDDILTRLNLELLNNKGPDVMILDGLDADSYLDFMAPLDRVSTDGVYQSILDRFTVGDDLLALPARISPYLLGRKAENTVEITSLQQFTEVILDTAQYITYSDDYKVINTKSAPCYLESYVQLFQLWYPAWADAIWADGKLNREVFKEFLTHTCQLSKLYKLNGAVIRDGRHYAVSDYYDYESNEKNDNLDFLPYLWETDGYMEIQQDRIYEYTIASPAHVGLYRYWRYNGETETNQHPTPHYLESIPGPDGTGAAVPVVIAGVRAGGNEAAGQEFVQLLLSRELQLGAGYHSPTVADGYPVMWRYTEELIAETSDYMHQEMAVENDFEETLNNLRTVVIDETLYGMALYAASCCYRYEPEQGMLDRGYSWEVLTVDEAVDVLDELSRIYLAEKR